MIRSIERPYPTEERKYRYSVNLGRRFGRLPPYEYWATCFYCGFTGYLAYEVTYRGALRPQNLICDNCYQDPLVSQWWHDHNWLSPNYMEAIEDAYEESA